MASTRLACLLLTIAALSAAPASARQDDGATHDGQRLSALQMIMEFRTLQLRIQNLVNLVLQENAAVADDGQRLQQTFEANLSATDPAARGHLERLQDSRDAVEEATAEGDQSQLQQLLEERRCRSCPGRPRTGGRGMASGESGRVEVEGDFNADFAFLVSWN